MADLLTDLKVLIPPPTHPRHARGDWTLVETDLGLQLPADYKQIVETYGYGEFCDNLSLLNPFAKSSMKKSTRDIIDQIEGICEICETEYPFYPNPGGLLPCCVNFNAHYICWLTEGDSDSWEIIVWDQSFPTWVKSEHKPLARFLVEMFSRRSSLTSLLVNSLVNQPNRAPWFTQWEMNPHTGQEIKVGSTFHEIQSSGGCQPAATHN